MSARYDAPIGTISTVGSNFTSVNGLFWSIFRAETIFRIFNRLDM